MRYGRGSEKRGYDVALICENGHVINSLARLAPERNTNYCDECGAKTIDACPACSVSIRGFNLDSGGGIFVAGYDTPSYCHSCGMPFPWTEGKIQTALAIADELDNLSEDERNQLKDSIPDLVKDSPQTQLAIFRFKKLAGKMGSSVVGTFREILVDVVSEAVKKALWPGTP